MARTHRETGGRLLDRRQALQLFGTAVTGIAVPAAQASNKKDGPADLVPGKDERLQVLGDKPIVLQTPQDLLLRHRITPNQALFVRNNQQLAGTDSLKPANAADGMVTIDGLGQPVGIEELSLLEQIEVEMVLQCSGNGRAFLSKAAPIKGTPWGRGGVGNVRFKGVPLAAVIKKYKVEIDPQARFLTATARTRLDQTDFEHSLPLADALKKSILAVQLNGEPLPAIHGGPVRLVTPGYYGTMQVKWLVRLRFARSETTNHYQLPQYRMPDRLLKPGENYDFTLVNSRPSWRMRVTSYILAPVAGPVPAGPCRVQGIAFNDGEAALDSVVVSADRGRTWVQARLEKPFSPYAWSIWSASVELTRGPQQIWARATDALGRSQPLDGTIFWNPHGYEWNGVDKVEVIGR